MQFGFLLGILLPVSMVLLFSEGLRDLPAVSHLKVNPENVSAFLESHLSRNQLKVDGKGNIYVGFAGMRQGKKDTDVFFRRFETATNTWEELTPVSQEDVLDRGAALWVSRQGVVHYAWLAHDEKTGKVEVRYRKSKNGGKDWSEPMSFEVGATVARYPQLAGDENNNLYLYITNAPKGAKERLLLFCSGDAGENWQAASISNAQAAENEIAREPQLLVGDKSRAFLVWLDTAFGGLGVVFSRTEDGGKTWSEPVPLNQDHTQILHQPLIQRIGDNLLVSWTEKAGLESTIYWNQSSDNGRTWKGNQVLYKSGVTSITTEMWGGPDKLLVIWSDYRNKMRYGGKRDLGERLWADLYSRKGGWLTETAEAGPDLVTLKAKDESYYNGFDAAPSGSGGYLVVYSENIMGYRRAIHGAFWNEVGGFQESFRISEPVRMVDSVWPKAQRVSEGENAVIYNQVRAKMFQHQPKSWLGDLILSRIQIQ
ncbi:MAG: exo-alpha-sialidase [Acidobacteriota bacterium]